ncbi:MAG: hypothetical protein K2M91_01560 [Lachnospiraceae bacterium]|nr:hypothetical protein [Lachnospiraceae bacterium]
MEQYEENIGTKIDLCLYRIQSAKENLKSAKILFDAKEYKGANQFISMVEDYCTVERKEI